MFVRIKLALSYGFSLSRCHNLCFFVGHDWTWSKGLNVMFFGKQGVELMLLAKEQKRRTSQGGSTFCLSLTLLITHLTDLNLITLLAYICVTAN